jgi:hypothetical protein
MHVESGYMYAHAKFETKIWLYMIRTKNSKYLGCMY